MISVSMEYLNKHFINLKNPEFDPGIDRYLAHLKGLNEVASSFGEPVEGNLFYMLPPATPTELPSAHFLAKRRDYATYVLTGSSLLEIGFNAGHSALLALTMNPGLRYLGVDFGNHAYTRPCFEYLRGIFGDRIDLWVGDSRNLVPAVRHTRGFDFDLYHIDGGHDFGVAYADMCNVLDLCRDGDVILFDDTNSGVDIWLLDEICDFFEMCGLVTRIECPRIWKSNRHVLFKVNKRK